MGWSQVAHFVQYLRPGSALYDELHPETAGWSHTDVMLADVFDAVAALHHAFVAANSKKKPKRPKPYPRPWAKHKETKHYGKDPIPLSEFNSWWESST